MAALELNAENFERVASLCSKWSERSLNVARALLVNGVSLSDTAATYEMSPQQANMVRTRFLEKFEKMRVESFMLREKPKLEKALEPFAEDIRLLQDKGYTMQQIIAYLSENGIDTSESIVSKFLKESDLL